MDKYQNLPFHPMMEKVVDILRQKTQNEDPVFFRLMVAYFFSKLASMMRTNMQLGDNQVVPVNMYAINLAPSGSGKGHSVAVIEEEVICAFRTKFLSETFPKEADKHICKLALARHQRDETDPDEELARTRAEFEEQGVLLFSFDSGTSAAIKQMRTKLLMARAGSMNLEIDEIGSNMTGNTEVLNAYLELFDTGRIKQKLIKNTRESVRSEDVFGSTPTNMLLFGTPTKLLNGDKTENEFYEMLEIGYARRCFFGFSRLRQAKKGQTAQDLYDLYHDPRTSKFLATINDQLGLLADPSQFNNTLKMQKNTHLKLYDYRLSCQRFADSLPEYDELRKSEISHRYFKVGKLAATYAFIDRSTFITDDHLENAIAMAEQSGQALKSILNRDRPYVKLVNYICGSGKELTQADLTEDLPFYRGSEPVKREMLNLAMAHGYKQGMYVKSEMIDGIQFLSGKKTTTVNLEELNVSYGTQMAENYLNKTAPFNKLHNLLCIPAYHWCSHHLREGYRDEAHVIPGADVVVLDIENSISLDTAKHLLKDYSWCMHTTKRHTDQAHRFRIVMPLTHRVELDERDFKDFMKNIFEWLPFSVDDGTGQRARKWMTFNGKHWYNNGSQLETLQFIPKTRKSEERTKLLAGQTNLDALERWFINNSQEGVNRNKKLMAYAYSLIDLGYKYPEVQAKVMMLNSKMDAPLDTSEISSTVLVTAKKRLDLRSKS